MRIHLFRFFMPHAQVMSWGKNNSSLLAYPSHTRLCYRPTGSYGLQRERGSFLQTTLTTPMSWHPWADPAACCHARCEAKNGEAQTSSQLQHQDDDGCGGWIHPIKLGYGYRWNTTPILHRKPKQKNVQLVFRWCLQYMCCRLILLEDDNISFILSTQEWKAPVDQYRGITVWMAISEGQQLADWSTCISSLCRIWNDISSDLLFWLEAEDMQQMYRYVSCQYSTNNAFRLRLYSI